MADNPDKYQRCLFSVGTPRQKNNAPHHRRREREKPNSGQNPDVTQRTAHTQQSAYGEFCYLLEMHSLEKHGQVREFETGQGNCVLSWVQCPPITCFLRSLIAELALRIYIYDTKHCNCKHTTTLL